MTTITIERTILDRLIEAWDSTVLPTHRDGMMQERMEDLRAELAKPVERVEPITLDQFRAIANRTATTYRHRSDPEKSSYAFVDGSSLDDFWRNVCRAIPPAQAWHDAPPERGWWLTKAGKATDILVDGAVILDRELREWAQARGMYMYWSISGWHVMIGHHFCTPSCAAPEDALLDCWNSGEYDDLKKCAALSAPAAVPDELVPCWPKRETLNAEAHREAACGRSGGAEC